MTRSRFRPGDALLYVPTSIMRATILSRSLSASRALTPRRLGPAGLENKKRFNLV